MSRFSAHLSDIAQVLIDAGYPNVYQGYIGSIPVNGGVAISTSNGEYPEQADYTTAVIDLQFFSLAHKERDTTTYAEFVDKLGADDDKSIRRLFKNVTLPRGGQFVIEGWRVPQVVELVSGNRTHYTVTVFGTLYIPAP